MTAGISELDLLAMLDGRFTDLVAGIRGLAVNNVLLSETVVFPASGIVSKEFDAPYASVALANHSPGTVVVFDASGARDAAPVEGRGVHRVGPGRGAVFNVTGHVLTLYGAAGEQASIQVFDRASVPGFGSANSAPPGTSQAPADTVAPSTASLPVTAWIEVYNETAGTWSRVRMAEGLADADDGRGVVATGPSGFNGATYDRLRTISAAGDGRGVAAVLAPSSTPSSATSGANAAVAITYGAVAGQRHRLTALSTSYSGAPNGGVVVTDGATTVLDLFITSAAPVIVPLPDGGIQGSVNTALTCTLAAGGIGVVGKVNAAKLTA